LSDKDSAFKDRNCALGQCEVTNVKLVIQFHIHDISVDVIWNGTRRDAKLKSVQHLAELASTCHAHRIAMQVDCYFYRHELLW